MQQLTIHASHWLELAAARHPNRQTEIDRLSRRLDEADGAIADEHGIFAGSETDGEIVFALERILAVMRGVAPLLADPGRFH